jgi:beta-xylosidase
LQLPGAQQQLLDAVLVTGTPTIVVLLTGRPYALGAAVTDATAIVQAFFAGQEGTVAVAGVLSGRVNPSGKLPVSIPASAGTQPTSYLAARLGHRSEVSNIDPTAAFPFGHGLGYSQFDWSEVESGPRTIEVDGTVSLSLRIRNTGSRAGAEIVQLYVHDPVASVVRPEQRLIGFTRVEIDAGAEVVVTAEVPAELSSFTSRSGQRIVEPGELVLGFGRSSRDIPISTSVWLEGAVRTVGYDRQLHALFTISRELSD